MEKPLARSGRPRLAGQTYQPGVARARLVAVSRRALHHARSAARRRRRRPLRQLPRLPRRLPDGRVSRALSSRCAALHLLSHHRAQGTDPARTAPAASATASTAATIVWRFARGTNSRRPGARRSLPRAPHCARRSLPNLARLDDAAFRALFAKSAGQAHRPRPLRAQCADRHRQFGRRRRWRARPSICSTIRRRSFAVPRSGRSAGSIAARLARRAGARRAAETDPEVLDEWNAALQ